MSDNPYQSSESAANADPQKAQSVSTARAAYNITSDMVFGLNVRWRDNIL